MKRQEPLKLNLQFFNDSEAVPTDGAGGEVGENGTGELPSAEFDPEPQVPKGLTEDDVEARILAEREKWIAELEEKERLSKLSAEERQKEEKEKQDTEIQNLKQQILSKDLKEKATTELRKLDLPIELTALLDYTSKESMDKSLVVVKETFIKSVESEVLKRLKGGTPKGIGGNLGSQNSLQKQIADSIRGGF